MDLLAQVLAQLADPFRIGLVVALVATTVRTESVTGTVIPLLLGVLFIAVIIPLTTQAGSGPLWLVAATGAVANLIILAAVLTVWAVVRRLRS